MHQKYVHQIATSTTVRGLGLHGVSYSCHHSTCLPKSPFKLEMGNDIEEARV